MKRLSFKVSLVWESDVTTCVGLLLIVSGIALYPLGSHFGMPASTKNTAAQALINLGALLITPRQKAPP